MALNHESVRLIQQNTTPHIFSRDIWVVLKPCCCSRGGDTLGQGLWLRLWVRVPGQTSGRVLIWESGAYWGTIQAERIAAGHQVGRRRSQYFSDQIIIFLSPGWSQRSWWICWIKTGHRCVTQNLPWSWTRVFRDISLTSPWSLTASGLQQSWLPWQQSRWGNWTATGIISIIFLLAELSEWKFEMSW